MRPSTRKKIKKWKIKHGLDFVFIGDFSSLEKKLNFNSGKSKEVISEYDVGKNAGIDKVKTNKGYIIHYWHAIGNDVKHIYFGFVNLKNKAIIRLVQSWQKMRNR